MFEEFGSRVTFFVVYIAEAHPQDGWQLPVNESDGVCFLKARTFEERRATARLCTESLGLTIPTLVDGLDDAASETFSAWPERIYIVGTDGCVSYRGGPGPYEFDPEEARRHLIALLESDVSTEGT